MKPADDWKSAEIFTEPKESDSIQMENVAAKKSDHAHVNESFS